MVLIAWALLVYGPYKSRQIGGEEEGIAWSGVGEEGTEWSGVEEGCWVGRHGWKGGIGERELGEHECAVVGVLESQH